MLVMAIFTLVMICEKATLQFYTSMSRKVETHRMNVIIETFVHPCQLQSFLCIWCTITKSLDQVLTGQKNNTLSLSLSKYIYTYDTNDDPLCRPFVICQWFITFFSFASWKQEKGFKAVTENSAPLSGSHGARQCKSTSNHLTV